ncbi:hypothetical protein Aperf_G00000082885 [Anoplocephala perfoliata]
MGVGEFDSQGFESIVSDGGVRKRIIQKGSIPVKPVKYCSAVVEISGTYEGGVNDGKVFQTSEGRKLLPKMELGGGRSLPVGLRIALLTMELGEICEAILHPPYGYDNREVLRYRIKLVDIVLTNDLRPKVLVVDPYFKTCFHVGQKLDIHFRGYCDGRLCHEGEANLYIGDTDYDGLPKAVIEQLNKLGKAGGWIKLENSKEISAREREKFGFPPIQPIWYEVEIDSSENTDECCNVLSLKQRADDFFEAGKSQLAENIYKYMRDDSDKLDGPMTMEIYEEIGVGGALAALQNGHPKECLSFLLPVKKDERYFLRSGQAYFLKLDYESAEKNFKEVLKINPENSEALEAMKLCQRKAEMKDIPIMLEIMRKHGMKVLAEEI